MRWRASESLTKEKPAKVLSNDLEARWEGMRSGDTAGERRSGEEEAEEEKEDKGKVRREVRYGKVKNWE